MNHNHFTRDIRRKGQCPACDKYLATCAAVIVMENFLYEFNVDHDECSSQAALLLKRLSDVGLSLMWKPDNYTAGTAHATEGEG